MERNDYTQQALKTWITEHPEEVQIAHACMTLVDEWNEFMEVYENRAAYDDERITDELGDVFYACAILQHLTSWSHIPDDAGFLRTSSVEVGARVKQAHDLGTKILRSQHLDYYDRDELDKKMQTVTLCLGDCLASFAKKLRVSVDTVLANNIRKLTDRHS